MSRYAIRQQIEALDPGRDHQQIVYLSTCFDFPFDTTRSLEFALFRTFCVPSVSKLLDRTGEFANRTQLRYDDTDIIVSEIIECGYDSQQGRRAIARMNEIHGRFVISNNDFLYVLSTFVYEPIRWNDRFGWRPLCENEKQSYFLFWRAVGQQMNIHDIPTSYEAFERFNTEYEREHFRFAETNRRVGTATRELFVSWAPRAVAPLTRSVIHALLDDPLIDAFGFPPPAPAVRWAVRKSMRLRAAVNRCLPPRRKPRLRTRMQRVSRPDGYVLEEVGPPDPGQDAE